MRCGFGARENRSRLSATSSARKRAESTAERGTKIARVAKITNLNHGRQSGHTFLLFSRRSQQSVLVSPQKTFWLSWRFWLVWRRSLSRSVCVPVVCAIRCRPSKRKPINRSRLKSLDHKQQGENNGPKPEPRTVGGRSDGNEPRGTRGSNHGPVLQRSRANGCATRRAQDAERGVALTARLPQDRRAITRARSSNPQTPAKYRWGF